MAKKTKLSATLPNGELATRTTARDYQYVIAGYIPVGRRIAKLRSDAEGQTRQAEKYERQAQIVEDEGYHTDGKTFVPEASVPKLSGYREGSNYNRTMIVHHPDKLREWAKNGRDRAAQMLAQAEELQGQDDPKEWEACAWSSRIDLAEKASAHWQKYDFITEIVPVN